MRLPLLALALLLIAATPATAHPVLLVAGAPEATDVTPLPPAAATARKAIDAPVPAWRVESVGLEGFLQLISQHTGAALRVNWAALTAAGVDREWTVIVRPNGKLSASKLLDLALADAAPAGGPALAWVLTDGTIDVSTREDIVRRHMVVRIYELSPGDSRAQARRLSDRAAAVAKLIADTVEPPSWVPPGHTGASIKQRDDWLIITQTPDNHRRIQKLLDDLRDTMTDAPVPAVYAAPPSRH